jgi:hypothetical protein
MSPLPPARDFQTSFLGSPAPEAAAARPAAPDRPSPLPGHGVTVADGRYLGGNSEVALDLRVDSQGCGVISGDLYRVLPDSRHYVASFRTVPGVEAKAAAGSWPIVGQDEHDRREQGRIDLTVPPRPAGCLQGSIELDGALEGLPSRRAIPFVAERQSDALRTLGLEVEVEDQVEPIASCSFEGRRLTVEEALLSAGLETYTTGISDRVPRAPNGWDMAQLHTLMSDFAQASLLRRTWEIHLLLLSRSDRSGLLGVMFDSSDALPRQGAAVFADAIRAIPGIDHDRKTLQTTVHELGHALNLAHRFERVVGRADSLSFMNYDWRYRGGNREAEYWRGFRFSFDRDELEFIRHAPLPPIIPGGARFHSAPYWSDGTGGYSPYVPEVPLRGWELTLSPPPGGSLLQFAQPVFLTALLTNRSERTVAVPRFILDPKAGFLEVLVRRVHAGTFAPVGRESLSFVPAMQRCFEWDAAGSVSLAHGESIEDNVNLTFGSGGFAFAEPGTYDVTALLVVFDQVQQRELIARSNTLRLRVATPKTRNEEREAMDLLTDEAGLFLSLGGSSALGDTRDRLQAIAEARGLEAEDPVAAYIMRALAIDASRPYVRYREGRFESAGPRLDEAVGLLDRLGETEMKVFDRATARLTRDLASRSQAQRKGKRPRALAGLEPRPGPERLSVDASRVALEMAQRAPKGRSRW